MLDAVDGVSNPNVDGAAILAGLAAATPAQITAIAAELGITIVSQD